MKFTALVDHDKTTAEDCGVIDSTGGVTGTVGAEGANLSPRKITLAGAVRSVSAADPAPVSVIAITRCRVDSAVTEKFVVFDPLKLTARPRAPTVEPLPVPST